MKLDFDCLSLLVPHLPSRADVLSFALTCRTIFTYAIDQVVFWRVRLDEHTAHSVEKELYHNFPSRLRLVRELVISVAWVRGWMMRESPKTVEIALQILRYAFNLKELKVSGFDKFGEGGIRLAEACKAV